MRTICKRPALAPFNTRSDRKVVLTIDASELGMGAVLEQEQDSDEIRPVAYWSSQFRAYEKNYVVGEKEALALVSARTNSESIFWEDSLFCKLIIKH